MPKEPRTPGAARDTTVSFRMIRSGVTMLTVKVLAIDPCSQTSPRLAREALGFFYGLLDAADHVEGLLRQVVVLAFQDLAEAANRLFARDVLPFQAGEGLGDEHGLAEEALHLSGAGDYQLIFIGKLVDAEDGDDVLQLLVALQHLLHFPRDAVVLVADDGGRQDAGVRREGIDRREDGLDRDAALQVDEGVQVGEGRGGRRVGRVVRGDVDGLDGGDGALGGRGDPLLERAHLGCRSVFWEKDIMLSVLPKMELMQVLIWQGPNFRSLLLKTIQL